MNFDNYRKQLFAAGVIATLIASPSAAALLNTNLVVNGGFESVDPAVTGISNGPLIQAWSGRKLYAYSHDNSSSFLGHVPDFANGPDPPNAGAWYFASTNVAGNDVRTANEFFQDIDVSTGPTAEAIPAGLALLNLSAYMSSVLSIDAIPMIAIGFRNAANNGVGGITLQDQDAGLNNLWTLNSTSVLIPRPTTSIRIALYGTPRLASAESFIDNVSLRISRLPEPATMRFVSVAMASAALVSGRRRNIRRHLSIKRRGAV